MWSAFVMLSILPEIIIIIMKHFVQISAVLVLFNKLKSKRNS